MAGYSIEIDAAVQDIVHFDPSAGLLFCNDGAGFDIYDKATGQLLLPHPGTAFKEPWTPPAGVTAIHFRCRPDSAPGPKDFDEDLATGEEKPSP